MWYKNIYDLDHHLSSSLHTLITGRGSLSAALEQHCTQLRVQLLRQKLDLANKEERAYLGITDPRCLIREIFMLGDDMPWIRARVIIPYATYMQYQTEIDQLGTKLLGQSFLFKQDPIRSEFEFTIQDKHFTRRSIFVWKEYKLAIIEEFLISEFALRDVSRLQPKARL